MTHNRRTHLAEEHYRLSSLSDRPDKINVELNVTSIHSGSLSPTQRVDKADVHVPKMAQRDTQFDGRRVEKVEPESELDSDPGLQSVSSSDKVRQTDVDGWPFRKAKDTQDAVQPNSIYEVIEPIEVPAGPARTAETYDMNHKRRGVALIFNHIHFKSMTTRNGSIKDCNDLKGVLSKMGFEVRVYVDPRMKTISTVLQSTAAEDHTDADCLIVAAMSHGESGLLHSSDTLYPVDMLWTPFTGDRCSSLIGKPKLFFIQACRGARLDKGVKIIHETDSRATTYSIPAFADIMVAYSTYDGFYSWRNPDAGSWFIQAICEEFKLNGRSRDLLTLMTFVNRRVAIEYQSYVPHNKSFDAKKQIPSVVSMLTRLVYFHAKNSDLIPNVIDPAHFAKNKREGAQSEK